MNQTVGVCVRVCTVQILWTKPLAICMPKGCTILLLPHLFSIGAFNSALCVCVCVQGLLDYEFDSEEEWEEGEPGESVSSASEVRYTGPPHTYSVCILYTAGKLCKLVTFFSFLGYANIVYPPPLNKTWRIKIGNTAKFAEVFTHENFQLYSL